MFLRRASALAVVTLILGGAVAIGIPNHLLSQTVAQNTQAPGRSDDGVPRWFRELNLNSEQVQRMQTIRNQYKDQISSRHQALRQAQQELRQLMAGDASPDQIREQYRQTQDLRQQLGQVRFESMLQMREVLTPEQRRQWAERMEKRRAGFRNRMRPNRDSQSFNKF